MEHGAMEAWASSSLPPPQTWTLLLYYTYTQTHIQIYKHRQIQREIDKERDRRWQKSSSNKSAMIGNGGRRSVKQSLNWSRDRSIGDIGFGYVFSFSVCRSSTIAVFLSVFSLFLSLCICRQIIIMTLHTHQDHLYHHHISSIDLISL